MDALRNVDRRLLIAGLGTLAVFGSFVMGAVFFAILQGLGLNEDLAWGLSVLMWLAMVALGILCVVYFFDSIKDRVEQVTVIQPVITRQVTPQTPTVDGESRPSKDQPSLPPARPASYRSMLMEGDKQNDQPE